MFFFFSFSATQAVTKVNDGIVLPHGRLFCAFEGGSLRVVCCFGNIRKRTPGSTRPDSLSNLSVVLDAQSSSVPCLFTLKGSRLMMSLGIAACAGLYGLAPLRFLGTAGNSFARNLRTSMHEDMVSPSFNVWAHSCLRWQGTD